MNLFYQPLLPSAVYFLDEEESRHCIKVLRRKAGDLIHITDGAGSFYDAEIEDPNPRKCSFRVITKTDIEPRPFSVHIAIAPTKNIDRTEWFVEKAVEIGIERITLVDCEHSERSYIRRDRLIKIAASAMKQSLKPFLPVISDIIPLHELITSCTDQFRFIAHVDPANPIHLKNALTVDGTYIVLIGPEGDFSDKEITTALAHGFTKVSLGRSRLRTETAALAACHILALIHE